jgi:hypothetical protein
VERGEPDGPLTGAWEAVRWPSNGGEGGGGWNSGVERARARRVANGRGGDECGEEGRAPHPFIGSEGEQGGQTGKGIGRPVVAASMPPSGSVGRGNGGVSGE